jgi:pyruvate/2-oxoglutarate dehydrogenase complex dihydrolipoamide dehydrogenase (E3) component
MAKTFDAIVVGTGRAGPSLATKLARSGMKVAIVERKLFGGTCVNTGCIPTKTLVASARRLCRPQGGGLRRRGGRDRQRGHEAGQGSQGPRGGEIEQGSRRLA